MDFEIFHVDAFASKVFGGNPAAIVPLEHWMEPSLMQQIASENNLSETAFFVKQTDGGGDYHLRWFTPDYEIDLCGHATLATAFIIKNFIDPPVSEISFSTEKAGILKVRVTGHEYELDFPSRPPQPTEIPPHLFASLGIMNAVEVLRSRDYFVVVPDQNAVENLEPDYSLMKQLDTIGVIVTAKGKTADVVSRCFYPGAGISEDPVTGSAHCNIVPYWAAKLGKTDLHCVQLSKRRGNLKCTLKGDRVLMKGECVLYMRGKFSV